MTNPLAVSSISIFGCNSLLLILFMAITISLTSLFFMVINFTKKAGKDKNLQYSLPPGPKPWPLVGCLPQMLTSKRVYKWIHSLMKQMDTEIACIRLGSTYVIPVTCPNIACEFLITNNAIMNSRPPTMATELLSMGYLTTIFSPYGDQWKKMKKVMAKYVLSPAAHRWQHNIRIEEADNLIRFVFHQCMLQPRKGGLVNIRTVARQYSGNMIRTMVFNRRFFGEGMEDGGPGFEEEEHVDAIFTIRNYIYAFCVSDYMPCLKGFDLDGHEKVMKKATTTVRKYHDPLIEERIQSWKDGNHTEVQDLLDVLITAKDENDNPLLSLQEIQAQIAETTVAAIDNPPNAFEWALAEMLNQPEILEKAVEELDRVVGKERLVQESDFPQLNYVKACVKEALRLHPIDPFNIPHVSMADTVVANYFIPKGSHILLSRHGLGRNPKTWNEPLKFQPERHLKNDGSEVDLTENELRFISFGAGRRMCMGINLGTSMAVMLFARLLHGFAWTLPPNESRIDLTEADKGYVLAKPLYAIAKPRMPLHLYRA